MPNALNQWYDLFRDVNEPRPNSRSEPCLSYTPRVMPDGGPYGGLIVYVLNVEKVRQTAGRRWKGIEEKLKSGEIPLAKLATPMELQTLKRTNILTLPNELTDIVRSALAPKA